MIDLALSWVRIVLLVYMLSIAQCFHVGIPHALSGLAPPLQNFIASLSQPDVIDIIDIPQLLSLPDVIGVIENDVATPLKIVDITFKEAILPDGFKDVVAIFLSEFAAGAIAGVAQKETALLDGNKDADANKDTFLAIAETNGLFFAVRGGLKAAAQLLGMTTGAASIATLVLAILLSEEFKIFSRRGPPVLRDTTSSLLTPDLKDSAASVLGANITTTEVLADVTKWITYDVTFESLPETFDSAIGCGALAGISSQLFREFGKGGFNSPTITSIRELPFVRVLRAAVEGSVQFLTYEATRQFLFPYIPDINPLVLEDMPKSFLQTILPS